MNKITHSHTAQYAVTMSGKLLPSVFICLQKATGVFGPKIQESIKKFKVIYTNVVVTCSKSGKLTTQLYNNFLKESLASYVGTEKFLLLIDSWGGQTNPALYDDIFKDEEGLKIGVKNAL